MRARFDRIFLKKTGYVLLDRQLRRLHRRKAELLRVLERPEIPLHTNGSENDIRAVVTKRKVSGGTVSQAGKAARDTMPDDVTIAFERRVYIVPLDKILPSRMLPAAQKEVLKI